MAILMLCDIDIAKTMYDRINPWNREQLQPASYDVTLSGDVAWHKHNQLLMSKIDPMMEYHTHELGPFLQPGEFVLATTVEEVNIPTNMAARLEGKSSLARMGLIIHSAGFIDPGFHGKITLEMCNMSPCAILLEVGQRIGQLTFYYLTGEAKNPYHGKYQGQQSVQEHKKD